ncbi:MAG: DUF3990 domain-containing protein [Clostridiales Family XIII bacterium]|jgi:hypothetical protein|nr:DUF3990 domain-containing protein [Clostridiales Family XIII bacterium]
MLIYHGSNQEISAPNLEGSRVRMDFGRGFYTSEDRNHADLFAKRKSRFQEGVPTVSVYDIDIDEMKKLYEVKVFDSASEEWFDYVVQNRIAEIADDTFDLVSGNTADENVRDIVNMYVSNPTVYVKSELIKQLKPEIFARQIVFKTERILGQLKFIESYLVR